MSKNTVTIAISVPEALVQELDEMAQDMQIARSAVATAIFSLTMKWMKGALTDAIQGRKEGESYTELRTRNLYTRGGKESE